MKTNPNLQVTIGNVTDFAESLKPFEAQQAEFKYECKDVKI